MQLITALRDMTLYLTVTKAVDRVRLTPDGEVCRLDAIFSKGTSEVVVLDQTSYFNEAIDGLKSPIGIDLVRLSAVLNHPHYKDAEAALVTSKDGLTVLMLKGSNESEYSMPVYTGALLEAYGSVGPFELNQAPYAIEFKPNQDTIEMLSYWKKQAEQDYDEHDFMTVFTRNDKVMGRFCHRYYLYAEFPLNGFMLSKNVPGELLPRFKFHASNMLKLLKLHEAADISVQVYAEGAVKINVTSEHACYVFVLTGDFTDEAEMRIQADLRRARDIQLTEQRMKKFAEENP